MQTQVVPTQTPAADRFARWSAAWSRLGFWLTLWESEAGHVPTAGGASPFWESLLKHCAPFRAGLERLARDASDATPRTADLVSCAGIRAVVIPLRHRSRPDGMVLACGLVDGFLDEEAFARFCHRHRLDGPTFRRLAEGLVTLSADQFDAAAQIVAQQMQSLHAESITQRDLESLSANLAQAYEELNLIYRLSSVTPVLERPVVHLNRVCRELIAASVVENIAVVLEPPDGGEPTLIQAGPLAVPPAVITGLYQQARTACTGTGPYVVNNIARHVEYARHQPWLHQFAFYPLRRKGDLFGGMLAINRVDGQDLGSYEIQLLGAMAERSAALLETQWLYDDLEHLFLGMLHSMVNSIDAKDPYTCGHSQRVAWLSRHVAVLAGVPEEQCGRVYLSGLLHDVGKIGISEAVLRKTGRLTQAEFEEMKRHPEIGARILESVPHVEDVIPGVLHHHERMDGRGYPSGLRGESIPLLGRIIGLADSFDAMTTSRTYRRAQPVQVAAAEIRRCAGTQFDPRLAELVLRQDLHSLHAQMMEFAQRPFGTQSAGALAVATGGRR